MDVLRHNARSRLHASRAFRVMIASLWPLTLSSCFTMAISDPSGKSQPVPDSVRKVLLPATVTADVVTAPAQVAVIGTVVAAMYASSEISNTTAPKAPVVQAPEAESE